MEVTDTSGMADSIEVISNEVERISDVFGEIDEEPFSRSKEDLEDLALSAIELVRHVLDFELKVKKQLAKCYRNEGRTDR